MKLISTIEIIKQIHKEEVVLVKIGTFYNTYFKDAIILNYLFGYKIKKPEKNVNNCGFPTSGINNVKYLLEQKGISYILIDRAHNYEEIEKQEVKENKYIECYEKAYRYVSLKSRMDNINAFLMENINNENVTLILDRVERAINEKG